jgi:hypothetical protein
MIDFKAARTSRRSPNSIAFDHWRNSTLRTN